MAKMEGVCNRETKGNMTNLKKCFFYVTASTKVQKGREGS